MCSCLDRGQIFRDCLAERSIDRWSILVICSMVEARRSATTLTWLNSSADNSRHIVRCFRYLLGKRLIIKQNKRCYGLLWTHVDWFPYVYFDSWIYARRSSSSVRLAIISNTTSTIFRSCLAQAALNRLWRLIGSSTLRRRFTGSVSTGFLGIAESPFNHLS